MEHEEEPDFTYQRINTVVFLDLLYCVPMGRVTGLDSSV